VQGQPPPPRQRPKRTARALGSPPWAIPAATYHLVAPSFFELGLDATGEEWRPFRRAMPAPALPRRRIGPRTKSAREFRPSRHCSPVVLTAGTMGGGNGLFRHGPRGGAVFSVGSIKKLRRVAPVDEFVSRGSLVRTAAVSGADMKITRTSRSGIRSGEEGVTRQEGPRRNTSRRPR